MACLHDNHSEHILKMLKKIVVMIIIIPLDIAAAATTTTEPKYVHSLNRGQKPLLG